MVDLLQQHLLLADRRLQARIGGLELLRAGAHPRLEQGVEVANLPLRPPALLDLAGQREVDLLQLAAAGQAQRQRHDVPQSCRRPQGRRGGQHLDPALHPIVGIPQGPDRHDVGRAAGENEQPEQQEDPRERQIPPLPHEVRQHHRDRVVGSRDQPVGDRVQPDELGPPHEAHAMRHEML